MKDLIVENPVLEAAIQSFVRYGVKKTSMSEIAKEAGISRPTLYASYKSKDEVLAEVIRYYTKRRLNEFQERCKDAETLRAKLDIYFDGMTLFGYDLLQNSPEGQESGKGISDTGSAAFEDARFWARDALAEVLMPYQTKIISSGQTVEQLAHLIVSTSSGFRYIAADREELLRLLVSLKAMILVVAEK